MKNKAIFKFNNGNMALLCSKCNGIIKIGKNFTKEERNAYFGYTCLESQYCDKCKKINNEL